MRFSFIFKEVILPAGLLSSLIIGAGMFALPYVFAQAGLYVGFLYLAIFTVLITTIHHMYAVVVTETDGKHRLVGYANIYLGRLGFWVGTITTGFGILLVLTAYIILASSFIEVVFSGFSGRAPYMFWLVGSLAIILSLRRLAKLEFLIVILMGVIVFFLFSLGVSSGASISVPNYSPAYLFLPYGVVLFSLGGRAGISTLADYYKRNKLHKRKLHAAIISGTVTPPILYTFFIFAVIWLSPGGVTPDALSGLSGISSTTLSLIGVLGLFALWTSYILMGLEVRDVMRYDLKFPLIFALSIVIGIPLLFFTLDFGGLIKILGLSGGVFLAIESIMVVMMYSKIRRWSPVGVLLLLVFSIGAVYELYRFFS